MMNIAGLSVSFITTMGALPWAGSEELWHGAASKMLKEGYKVTVYFPGARGWAQPLRDLIEGGGKVVPYGTGSGLCGNLWFKVKQKIPLLPSRFKSGTKDCNWMQSDLIVVSQGACFDGIDWLRRIHEAGRDYVILCQANMECMWPNDDTVEQLNQFFVDARMVCFVSAENERLFRIQTGYTSENTTLVWNPLQPSTPSNMLPWPDNHDDIWRMAMVGRIEPFAKGQDLMLEILSFEKWRARKLHVTLYGRGPWEKTARKIVADRKLTNVGFGGYASPSDIWQHNQILALPSRHEGMSLAMLEAMWLGRPVVATSVAGSSSEIIDNETGYLAAAPSVELWDQVMERAWAGRNEWSVLGHAASLRVRSRMNGDPINQFKELLVNAILARSDSTVSVI